MANKTEELSAKDYLKAEKYVNEQNEKLLKTIGEKYGKPILDEIEYELFADTGSVGLHRILDAPKGKHERCEDTEKIIRDAWFDFTPGFCEHTKDAFDYSCYLEIKPGIYFKYNAIK